MKIFPRAMVIVITIFYLIGELAAARKLVMIECVVRHGVRYPQFANPYDYSNITAIDNA